MSDVFADSRLIAQMTFLERKLDAIRKQRDTLAELLRAHYIDEGLQRPMPDAVRAALAAVEREP